MEPHFKKYLHSIGMAEIFCERTEFVISLCNKIYEGKISEIFVNDYTDKDGIRNYPSLWLFRESGFVNELKNFLTEFSCDALFLINNLSYWEIKALEYDLENSSDKSRLLLNIRFHNNCSGTFQGSKSNCDKLAKIFKELIVPNMR
jgi:hypothetical protein